MYFRGARNGNLQHVWITTTALLNSVRIVRYGGSFTVQRLEFSAFLCLYFDMEPRTVLESIHLPVVSRIGGYVKREPADPCLETDALCRCGQRLHALHKEV